MASASYSCRSLRVGAFPSVHWIEGSWMINDYGPNGEKVAQFWTGVWDGEWGPLPCRPIFITVDWKSV